MQLNGMSRRKQARAPCRQAGRGGGGGQAGGGKGPLNAGITNRIRDSPATRRRNSGYMLEDSGLFLQGRMLRVWEQYDHRCPCVKRIKPVPPL